MSTFTDPCVGCSRTCYEKRDGLLRPRDCYLRKYLKNAYHNLLTGSSPPKSVITSILDMQVKPNSLVYYPYPYGESKAAALILMKMKISVYRLLHTHTLIDIFVSKSEEDVSLNTMTGAFYLLLHGLVQTPNRRLMDLIMEFVEYRLMEQVPFLVFSVIPPEQELMEYFKNRGLKMYTVPLEQTKGKRF